MELREFMVSNPYNLTEHQREVLARVAAAPAADDGFKKVYLGDEKLETAKELLIQIGYLEVDPNTGRLRPTDDGNAAMEEEGVTDEMGQLTDHGQELAYKRGHLPPQPKNAGWGPTPSVTGMEGNLPFQNEGAKITFKQFCKLIDEGAIQQTYDDPPPRPIDNLYDRFQKVADKMTRREQNDIEALFQDYDLGDEDPEEIIDWIENDIDFYEKRGAGSQKVLPRRLPTRRIGESHDQEYDRIRARYDRVRDSIDVDEREMLDDLFDDYNYAIKTGYNSDNIVEEINYYLDMIEGTTRGQNPPQRGLPRRLPTSRVAESTDLYQQYEKLVTKYHTVAKNLSQGVRHKIQVYGYKYKQTANDQEKEIILKKIAKLLGEDESQQVGLPRRLPTTRH